MDWPISRQRQAGRGHPELKTGTLSPREASSTKLQAGFIANQDFLGFWTVDIHREGHSPRSAPQKRHTAHLRRAPAATQLSGWDGEAIRRSPHLGECAHQAPGSLSCSDLGRAQNTAQPSLRLVEYPRT